MPQGALAQPGSRCLLVTVPSLGEGKSAAGVFAVPQKFTKLAPEKHQHWLKFCDLMPVQPRRWIVLQGIMQKPWMFK